MSDREQSNPAPGPDPPETRCIGTSPHGVRCALPAGHEDPRYHVSESGARWWGDPYPPLPPGPASENIVLRQTFKLQLLPEDATAIETTAEAAASRARQDHDHSWDMVDAIEAATVDLQVTADWLDWYADDCGDRPERHEVRLAAAALDAVPVIARHVEILREHVQRARATAPAD